MFTRMLAVALFVMTILPVHSLAQDENEKEEYRIVTALNLMANLRKVIDRDDDSNVKSKSLRNLIHENAVMAIVLQKGPKGTKILVNRRDRKTLAEEEHSLEDFAVLWDVISDL